MGKKKVIVKNINSIQNFGAMDILCTDKTGTLTQDRVALEDHLNVNGVTDYRVLASRLPQRITRPGSRI
jgi:Mg2+-importing ATPase